MTMENDRDVTQGPLTLLLHVDNIVSFMWRLPVEAHMLAVIIQQGH